LKIWFDCRGRSDKRAKVVLDFYDFFLINVDIQINLYASQLKYWKPYEKHFGLDIRHFRQQQCFFYP